MAGMRDGTEHQQQARPAVSDLPLRRPGESALPPTSPRMLGGAHAVHDDMPAPELARTRVRLFAEAVRARRMALGLAQAEVAKDARLDESVIAEIENGERGPNLHELFDLAEALGTRPAELLRSADPAC
jgi:ribosome-binding protein aMBF1 (putative translation factor)